MEIGPAGENGAAPRSVRVEVDGASPGAPIPDAPISNDKRPAGFALAAIVAVCALVGAVLFLLAPESGQAADGTPISPPTSASQAPTTELGTTTEAVEEVSIPTSTLLAELPERSELGEPIFPLEAYESAEPPGFLFTLGQLDTRFFALVFDGTGTSMVTSPDGLTWEPATTLAQSGAVVGLGNVDNRLVAAVNVEEPVDFSVLELGDEERRTPFDIRFFETTDGATWEPSTDFAPIVGEGVVFFAEIGADAVAVPTLTSDAEPPYDELVEFFDGALQPQRARQVCLVEHSTDRGSQVASLYDCDRNLLGDLLQEDAPALFREQGFITSCVNDLRAQANMSQVLHLQKRGPDGVPGPSVSHPIGHEFIGIGSLFGSTYITSGFGDARNSYCLRRSAAASFSDWTLMRTTFEDGSSEIDTDLATTGGLLIAQTPSGDAIVIGTSAGPNSAPGILRSPEPYTDWEFVALGGASELRFAQWSATRDASLLMGSTGNRWVFAHPDGRVVQDLPVLGGDNAQLLLATEEYAIVQLDFERPRLLQVPLSGR